MRFYSSIGPNPRVVRMFAAERGVPLESIEIDILAGDNRREPYLSINPLGTTPALVLDDGQAITETIAACEYLDETAAGPTLIGATPAARAVTRTWVRRLDLGFTAPLTLGFRASAGRALFAPRMIVPDQAAAGDLTAMAFVLLDFVEQQGDAGDWIVGDALTLADIVLFCFVEFAVIVGMTPLDGRPWLTAWHARLAARPSAAA